MRTVRFARCVGTGHSNGWGRNLAAVGQIGLDRWYLLCYIATCIEARRTAGPFFPPQADSTTPIRIRILVDRADVCASFAFKGFPVRDVTNTHPALSD